MTTKKGRAGLFYKLLGNPWIYKFSLDLLAPGYRKNFNRRMKAVIDSFPIAKSYLDVGCGPRSWLTDLGVNVVGVDISMDYVMSQTSTGNLGVMGSADLLSFKSESFDAVWSVGLLHHLPDSMFQMTCSEMQRVCTPGGYIAIIDAVTPRYVWTRPIPALLRKLDRGRYVRSQEQFERLISGTGNWTFQRFTYTYNGLEGILALQIKS
jgi:SAM-dependent methyltransferase